MSQATIVAKIEAIHAALHDRANYLGWRDSLMGQGDEDKSDPDSIFARNNRAWDAEMACWDLLQAAQAACE